MTTARWLQPPGHILSQLGIQLDPGHNLAQIPVGEGVATRFGETRLGVLATLVDSGAGAIGLLAARPRWLVTTYLNLHVWTPPVAGLVTAHGTVVKISRNAVFLDVDLVSGDHIGRASIGFTALPERPGDPVMPDPPGDGKVQLGSGVAIVEDVLSFIGRRVVDASTGSTETAFSDRILNNLGILNGGVICMLAEEATLLAAASALAQPISISQLSIDFVSAVRTGPICTRAQVVGRVRRGVIVKGQVLEAGSSRLAALVTAEIAPRSSAG
jgi:acyl-coenzyme A thioesterase PaaI-like protein